MNEFWRRLLYRWFVQYNPLYLVSAMLVLGGTILTSRGLATEGSVNGWLGVAVIAEVYALALIGGAALLTRIGQRRPAVLLALLAAAYQCDLTLHTETCTQHSVAGICAALAWLALFALKLFALGWAMRVRISLGALATALLGAGGLVLGPFLVENALPSVTAPFLCVWVFALALIAPTARVRSETSLDPWGQTVLSRTMFAIWTLWGVLLGLHVLFWASGHNVPVAAIVPVVPLVIARRMRSELGAWVVIGGTMVVACSVPAAIPLVSVMAAVILTVRAFSTYLVVRGAEGQSAYGPYRFGDHAPHAAATHIAYAEPLSAAARARHLAGALLFLCIAGHAHPLAIVPVALFVATALFAWLRRATPFAVPALAVARIVAASGLIPTPHTTLGWGSATLIVGFVLLLGGLAVSYRLRGLTAPGAPEGPDA